MANRPETEIRLGCIKATIWANQTKRGVRHGIKLSRIYKDGLEWGTTDSFRQKDMPTLAKVADLAHAWVQTHKRAQAEEQQQDRSRSSQELERSM